MSFLLDTNIISAVAPTATDRPAHLVDWMNRYTDKLFLSVISVAEVRAGIAKLRRQGASRKASLLAAWWDSVERLYASRILTFDLASARFAGELIDRARTRGTAPNFADVAVAATAQAHDLTIVTRNTKHFVAFDLPLLDPYRSPPV